ncbi:hypothetical protein [Sutcliffiella cohnii]|uniref:hypothetical protein n=1 Tax=Sutcliffiella cohnii TaxID=33932 RepID=UPI002E23D422|nr:hypothetical protein [Sutcliffiella cohnii]
MKEQIKKFDDLFPDGIFAISHPENTPKVKVRALHNYCKERGITPAELSQNEMEQFLIK